MLAVTTTGSRILRRYIDELKVALHTSWEELPQDHINKASCGGELHQALDCLCGCHWWSRTNLD